MAWLWLLMACDELPYDNSRVESLQVVTVVAEPPEVTPGSTFTLTAWVANPTELEIDLLLWSCTAVGGACVEAGPVPRPLTEWAKVVRGASGSETVRFDVPSILGVGLEDGSTPVTFIVWALACESGRCPVIDDVASNPEPASAEWTRVSQDLATPDRWLREVSLDRASLALRRMLLSVRPLEERNLNPVVATDAPEVIEVETGSSVTWSFSAIDGVEARLFSTTGGFGTGGLAMTSGNVRPRWLAPKVPGTSELWVVVEDGAGGATVWNQTADVR